MRDPRQAILLADGDRIAATAPVADLAGARVLVTGASGLVGLHILGSLAAAARRGAAPANVVAIANSNPAIVSDLFGATGFVDVYRRNLADHDAAAGLGAFDVVIHAAGYGQPGKFLANPLRTLALNAEITQRLIEQVRPGGRFLFVSTSEVYSGLPPAPHREDEIGTTTPAHPRACYIEGKRYGETVCHAARATGLSATVGRLALAYGPGAQLGDARVLNSFIERALTTRRIRLQDAGRAWRTYGYVADAVTRLWQITLRGREVVYNVGGESRTTIGELAQAIGGICNVPVEVPTEEVGLAGAPADVSLSHERYNAEFGPQQFISLDEGLRRTVAWYRVMLDQSAHQMGDAA